MKHIHRIESISTKRIFIAEPKEKNRVLYFKNVD